jgi:hypothetical protein
MVSAFGSRACSASANSAARASRRRSCNASRWRENVTRCSRRRSCVRHNSLVGMSSVRPHSRVSPDCSAHPGEISVVDRAHLVRDPRFARVAGTQRHDREIVRRVTLLLPALRRQILAEIAFLIQQSHPDQRDAQIAGGLEVVAGEDAEPARVNRQGLGQAELQRKLRGQRLRRLPVLLLIPGAGARHVVTQAGGDRVQVREERLILGQLLEPLPRDGPEHQHRVVT